MKSRNSLSTEEKHKKEALQELDPRGEEFSGFSSLVPTSRFYSFGSEVRTWPGDIVKDGVPLEYVSEGGSLSLH